MCLLMRTNSKQALVKGRVLWGSRVKGRVLWGFEVKGESTVGF